MDDTQLDTAVSKLSDGVLAEAIQKRFDIGKRKAEKLEQLYRQHSTTAETQTLEDVLDNIEVDGDIEVLRQDTSD